MNLRWNKSEFGNVQDLRIPPHRIWKPDVLLYNRWVKRLDQGMAEVEYSFRVGYWHVTRYSYS